MAHINLLPWREQLRKEQREDFVARILLFMILTAVLMVVVHLRVDQMINYQSRRNGFLEGETRLLDEKIKEIQTLDTKKRHLLARMEVIQQLQVSRPEMVHLFDEFARRVPEGVSLIDLTQSDKTIVINGMAQSNARVSGFLRELESSPWLSKPALRVIQVKSDRDPKQQAGLNFTIQVTQTIKASDGTDR